MQFYQTPIPQNVMLTQQPNQLVNSCVLPPSGNSRYSTMASTQPLLMHQRTAMVMQQPVMIMQNRPVVMHPRQMTMTAQQYPMAAQSMPMMTQQQYSMEPTEQYQAVLRAPASVVSEPLNSTNHCRNSILSQTQSMTGMKTLAGAQSQTQNPPTRKSVTINLKPEVNSSPADSSSTESSREFNPDSPKVLTEPPNQNAFISEQGIPFTATTVDQYNNSGQIDFQSSHLSGGYAPLSSEMQATSNAFYSTCDVPRVDPPHLDNLSGKQQFPVQFPCNQPSSIDSKPYMLPKALHELSEDRTIEQLADIDVASDAMLEANLTGAEPAGDSQRLSNVDPASQIKLLKTKQTVMECVMRKLLRSMKQIQDSNPERKNKAEAEAEHRLKMARMMQLLMLQRKNLQQQIEVLSQSYNSLSQKHQCLKTYSEGCVAENMDLNKKCRKLQSERDGKDAQIKALMQLSCKLKKKLEGHAHTELALENTALEVKRLVCDNENLKAANQQLEASYAENAKERENVTLQNSQLKMDLDRIRAELANQRVRTDKVSAENTNLRNQLSLAEAGNKNAAKKSVEYGQLKEAYENLQFDHQRLQMLYISETETRRELHNQLQEVNGNIRVISRFRPAEEYEESDIETPFEFCAMDKIFVCGKSIPTTVAYQRQLGINQPQAYVARDEFFAFNRVFQENANQSDIFEEIRPMIGSFVDGYNVCILAYGPTGSGKTYTMQGTKSCPGICQRAVAEVFALCDSLQGIWCTEINVAMFEIHNEVIYDLLAPQITPVKLCDNGSDVRLVNAEEKITTSEQETMHWIEKGYVRRKVSSTRLNSESSRSHLIIRMHLNLVSTIDNQKRTSSLVLCDLAGSESAERIEANETLHMETGYINRSLVTLARVFETLRRKSGQCASTGLAIPYRDSKLTHLLKPCLGGQAKCVLIVTASPEQRHLDRTLKALEFAQRAMQVSLGRPAKNSRILVSNQTPRT